MEQEEYLVELDNKLLEEVNEYKESKSLEEMADVLEVLYAICEARGYVVEDLLIARNEKMERKGAFTKHLF